MSSMDFDKSHIQFKIKQNSKKTNNATFSLERLSATTTPRQAIQGFDTETSRDKLSQAPVKHEALSESEAGSHSRAEFLQNAKVLVKNGEYEMAKNILIHVLRSNPDDDLATLWLARCYKGVNEWSECINCFHVVWKVNPSLDLTIEYADVLYDSGDSEKALSMYQYALTDIEQEGKELLHVLKNMGNIYVRLSDFDAAEEYYNKAYTLDPDSDVLLVNFGTLELQRQNYGLAIDRFRRAVEMNRENDKAWVGLALVHRSFGDFELSEANLERALDINPYNVTGLRLYADWSIQRSRPQAVVTRIDQYLAKYSDDPEVLLLSVKMEFIIGRIPIAQLRLKQVEKLTGRTSEINKLEKLIAEQRQQERS